MIQTPYSIFQTLLNQQYMYAASLVPAYIILLFSFVLAFRLAGGSWIRLKGCLTCSSPLSSGQAVPVIPPQAYGEQEQPQQ